METIQPIEGITPGALWNTLYVILALCLIVITVYKVVEIVRKERERRQENQAKGDTTIKGQLSQITKKLDAIDSFMQETNSRFERDNRRLNNLEKQQDEMTAQVKDIRNGVRALCRSSLAHLNHDITGNHVETLKEASGEITDYLSTLV